jgi:hypothetical protein
MVADHYNVISTRDVADFKRRKALVAPLFSLSSVANNEHRIHNAGISKLKARLQKAAESGETLNLMKYFSFLTFVSGCC